MRVTHLLATASLLVAAAAPVSVLAQETAGNTTSYPASFFARVQPTSAYDMVLLVPGFRVIEGDTELRGYSGAAGNVLVGGQRLSGKAETLENLLKRIPAARVERVELIRAGAPGYDFQGYALLVNVVLASGGRVSGRLEAEGALFRHGYRAPRGSVQVGVDLGERVIDLFGAVYREIDDEHGFGSRNRFAEDGSPVRLADYFQPEGTNVVETTAAYRQPLLGGTIRLNGLFQDKRMFANIGYDVLFPEAEVIRGRERNHTRTYEGAVRYERSLGATSDLELVGSYRSVSETGLESETAIGGSDRSDERSRASETILRAAFRHHGGPFTLEVGGEGAINILDSHNQFFEDEAPVPLPNAEVRVEEKRAEFFSTLGWTVSPQLTAEAGLRYEVSRLSQTGDTNLSKSLAFLKPRARLGWSPTKNDELRLLVEREVGQLDFSDFVGAASLNSGTVSAGNRDLEPDSLWRAEIAYEHRFGSGSIVVAARREWISNLVDQFPLVADGEIFDAVGNIGNARRDVIEANLKLPLDGVGLKGVMVSADALFKRGRVIDPTTGERRKISEDEPVEAKISLTHDIPAWKLRWGGSFAFAEEETSFKIGEIQRDRVGGRLDLFVEYKPDARWTIRLFGKNLTDSPVVRTRDIFTGLRGDSAFKYSDIRTLRSGPYVGINIQRSFGG